MKLRTVIYSLLLAILCMGCSNTPSMRQLEDLEARINDAPDSVLAVLTATDAPRWGERRALHALLTVQAQDKSGNYPLEAVARNATAYGIIALHNVKKNDKAAAENAMARAWKLARTEQDTTMLWQKSYRVFKALGYADKALGYYESLYAYQDSVVRITLRQPLIASLHDYYHSELDLAKARNLNYRYFIGFSVLTVLARYTTHG